MTNYPLILCPVDFSDHSDFALEQAAINAASKQAKLQLLYVLPQINYYDLTMTGSIVMYPGAEELFEQEKTNAEKKFTTLIQEWQKKFPTVEMSHQIISYALPGESIIKAATDAKASLIVLGSHGRKGISRLLMGSVAEYVLRHAPCPVIICKK